MCLMQRILVVVLVIALVFATTLNVALLIQNNALHQQIQANTNPGQPEPAQTADLNKLKQQLATAEQDRVKAIHDATSARAQLTQYQQTAQQRDSAESQVQSLQQENQDLHNQINNLQQMNQISSQVTQMRGLTAMRSVPREFMNQDQLRTYFTNMLNQSYSNAAMQREHATL